MRRLLATFLAGLLSTSSVGAALLGVAQSGNMPDATTWYLLPGSNPIHGYGGWERVNVTTGTPRYTPYFIPQSVAHECMGVWVYVWGVTGTTAFDVTASLMEGAVVRSSATMTFQNGVYNANYGPQVGWVFFKIPGYVFGNTTANTWRFMFSTTSLNTIYFRYAFNISASPAWAYAVNVNQAPNLAGGDALLVGGHGTTAGSFSTNYVTATASGTFGDGNYWDPWAIGKGGTIGLGPVQTASYTFRLFGNIRVTGSKVGDYGLEFGTPLTPLTSSYVQTLFFTSSTVRTGIIMNDGNSEACTGNYSPPAISLSGNYRFNQTTQEDWWWQLAATSTAGTNTLVFNRDVGLRPSGGDVLVVGASGGVGQVERHTTTAYNPTTRTATLLNNLTSAHGASYAGEWARVWLISSNLVMDHSSVIQGDMYTYGSQLAGATGTRIYMNNVEIRNFRTMALLGLSSDSVVRHLRLTDLTVSNVHLIGARKRTVENSVMHLGNQSPYVGDFSTLFLNVAWLGTTGVIGITGNNNVWDSNWFEGKDPTTYGCNNTIIRSTLTASAQGVQFYNGTGNRVIDCVEGWPVRNTRSFSAFNPSFNDATIINLSVNSPLPVYNTAILNSYPGSELRFQRYNRTGQHIVAKPEGVITNTGAALDDSTVRSVNTNALKLTNTPLASQAYVQRGLFYEIPKAVSGGKEITVTGYFRKNSTMGTALPYITLATAESSTVQAVTMSAGTAADTWERFTLSTSATNDTYATITLNNPTTDNAGASYWADMLLSVGDPINGYSNDSGIGQLWREGRPTADFAGGVSVSRQFQIDTIAQSTIAYVSGGVGGSVGSVVDVSNISTSTGTIAGAVWNASTGTSTTSGEMGHFMRRKLATKDDILQRR